MEFPAGYHFLKSETYNSMRANRLQSVPTEVFKKKSFDLSDNVAVIYTTWADEREQYLLWLPRRHTSFLMHPFIDYPPLSSNVHFIRVV